MLLVGTPNGSLPGYRLTQVVYNAGIVSRPSLVNAISVGQPGVAVATNGITDAYVTTGSVLVTKGAVAKNFKTVMLGGVGAVALN